MRRRSTWATLVLAAGVLCALLFGAAPRAYAEDTWAVGAAPAWALRRDFGEGHRAVLSPELVGFRYFEGPAPALYFRWGARLGGHGFDQGPLPDGVELEEWGLALRSDFGVVYDWVLLPSLSMGAGLEARFIDLEVGEDVQGTEALDRFELLPSVHAQVGVGLPVAEGLLVIEPFLRVENTFGDDRTHLRYGVEFTLDVERF